MQELTVANVLLRMFVAIVTGGVIGLERGMKNRPAGLRTYMLVSLGACVVMITNQYMAKVYPGIDPVRMGAQVVSGIGFLGAGTIIVTARHQIKGLTTAAGLWATACVGLATGVGLFVIAIPGCLAICFIMIALHEIDFRMRKNTRMATVYIELANTMPLGKFIYNTRQRGIELSDLQVQQESRLPDEPLAFVVTIRGQKKQKHAEMLAALREIPGIVYIDEM